MKPKELAGCPLRVGSGDETKPKGERPGEFYLVNDVTVLLLPGTQRKGSNYLEVASCSVCPRGWSPEHCKVKTCIIFNFWNKNAHKFFSWLGTPYQSQPSTVHLGDSNVITYQSVCCGLSGVHGLLKYWSEQKNCQVFRSVHYQRVSRLPM